MGRLYSGLVSISFRKHSVREIISAAADSKLEAVEWGGDVHVTPGDVKGAAETGRLTRDAGMFVSSYGSYYRITGDPAARRMVPDDFKAVCESAMALETGIVRIWGGTKSPDKLTPDEFAAMCDEADVIAGYAGKFGLKIALECHNFTVTEDFENALRFIDGAKKSNIYFYWQPNQLRTFEYNCDAARAMNNRVLNVHVFNWSPDARHPLIEGEAEWKRYIDILSGGQWPDPASGRGFLLEFMHDDRIETLKETAATLNRWINNIKGNIKMTKVMKIEGMMCMRCAARVKKALEAVAGVETAEPDLEKKECTVILSEDVDDAVLKNAVEEQGYKVV